MEKKVFAVLIYCFVLLLLIFIFFINKKNYKSSYKKFTFFSMDTIVEITYQSRRDLKDIIVDEFERISKKFSPLENTSVVYSINHRSNNIIFVDEETDFLIKKSLEIAKATDGKFDITVEPLMEAYGFYDKKYKVPDKEELEFLLKSISYNYIKRIKKGAYVFKKDVKIDLGGIAKGYAVDRVGAILKKHGVKNYLVNAGGEIKVSGRNPNGNLWRIGIRSPRGKGIVKVLTLTSLAIATSGDYERFFIFNGMRYYHIISPFDGYPWRNGWKSITVVSKNCMVSDAISTALFGFKRKELLKKLEELSKKFGIYYVYGIDNTHTAFEFISNFNFNQ